MISPSWLVSARKPHYDYTYDNASRITAIDSVLDGLTTYTNDHTGQADESYDYDGNGNRTSNTIGDNNQILSDGTYDYEYDDEGNMVAMETISTGERIEYAWDHRNRLVSIVTKNALGVVTKQVDQSYDVFQRWVRRSIDADGAGVGAAIDTFFTYEGNQIVLAFDGDDDTDLTNRYLWGDMVDQILADEQLISLSTAGDVVYPLTDHLNTTRDLATYDAGTNITTNASHRRFDSFGNIISESNGSVTILVGFTARPFDTSTELQYNTNRWFVSTLGVWMSEDPIGFEAGDQNLKRYVANDILLNTDPMGLASWRKGTDTYTFKTAKWHGGSAPDRAGTGLTKLEVDKLVHDAVARWLRRDAKIVKKINVPCPEGFVPGRGIVVKEDHEDVVVRREVRVQLVKSVTGTWYVEIIEDLARKGPGWGTIVIVGKGNITQRGRRGPCNRVTAPIDDCNSTMDVESDL